MVERAQIPFPSFDGSEFRDWKAKAEQFFELEGTLRPKEVVYCCYPWMTRLFAWQRHYMQNTNNKGKSWQQILKHTKSKFGSGSIDDPIVDLARLKQEGTLLDYLERYDTLLALVAISKDLSLSFFLSGLTIELEKSIRVRSATSVQDTIRIARLQDEVLQVMAKKFSPGRSASFESRDRYVTSWSAASSSNRSYPISTLNQNQLQRPTASTSMSESKGSTETSISRKQISERIARFMSILWR